MWTCPLKPICSRFFHFHLQTSPISEKECTLPVPVGCHGGPRPTHDAILLSPRNSLLTSSIPPPPTQRHTAARNCSITAVLTPVHESRLGTFKSKVTASEAFNLNLKGRAPSFNSNNPHLHPRPLYSHILDHPVPCRYLFYVWLCVCVHLSWMLVLTPVANKLAVHLASVIKVSINSLFL